MHKTCSSHSVEDRIKIINTINSVNKLNVLYPAVPPNRNLMEFGIVAGVCWACLAILEHKSIEHFNSELKNQINL